LRGCVYVREEEEEEGRRRKKKDINSKSE